MLFGAVVGLLFTVVFPAVEPLLPWSDVTVVEAPPVPADGAALDPSGGASTTAP